VRALVTGNSAPEGGPLRIGRFQIVGRLGAGGFGTVYRAYDPDLERDVALKVPQPGTLGRAGAVERFLREARAAACLQHANIVPVYEVGHDTTNDHLYIASAFVQGRTLDEVIEEGQLTLARRVEIAYDLASALAYAHQQGIVHRDVKPANVIIDETGKAHLMDFGLAYRMHAQSKLTQEGVILGTPAYLAPEQARRQGNAPLQATDQYSMGVILYELLCGRTPFEGPPEIVIFHATHSDPLPPRTFNPEVPPELEAICLRAMAKKAQDRFSTMSDFAAALAKYCRTADAQNQSHCTALRLANQPGVIPLSHGMATRAGWLAWLRWWWAAAGAAAIMILVATVYVAMLFGDGASKRSIPPVPGDTLAQDAVVSQDAVRDIQPSSSEPDDDSAPTQSPIINVVSSYFADEDNEGWTTRHPNGSGNATRPIEIFQSDIGFHLQADDVRDGLEWGWHAPAKYRGNHAEKFGKCLKYLLWTDGTYSQVVDKFVRISSAGMALYLDGTRLSAPVAGQWTPYCIQLDSTEGWKRAWDGNPATDEEIKQVLGAITDLRIKGEFAVGQDRGCLDNVEFGVDR
jgi:serine/threonine protein kinase